MMQLNYPSAWKTCVAAACLASVCTASYAQENTIESVTANLQGTNVVVKVNMKNPVKKPPSGFAILTPARIALDFADTTNGTDATAPKIALGDVKGMNIMQAGNRSRMVFNLKRPLNFATAVDGNAVIVTIDGSGGVAHAVNAAGVPVKNATAEPSAGLQAIKDIDFRRGTSGNGRVIIDLPRNHGGVDVRQDGKNIVVDVLKANLPDMLRRRLDVTDFGTPVSTVTATSKGDNVRLVIAANGLWEHSAYQSDSQLVVEVHELKEDPNKLTQGSQGYRGEKLSLNFQNVEVRAMLQVIADFTGLNVITSDTVAGNLTLRLKDVPWDQALDIVMQAKGLDMRKNGNVIWIAPKDELLAKEKLELEARSQIAELEPVRTETFQLNYQKAEAFKTLLDNAGGNGRSILTKRGSVVIDPRTNQMFVTDIAAKIEDVRSLIKKTDVASRQVLIEARIVEATDGFSRNLGVKLGFGAKTNTVALGGRQADAGSGPTPVGGNAVNLPANSVLQSAGSVALTLFNSAASRFISLELSALESDGKGKILSSPRVITADQLKATIEQGTELPYQSATSSGATALQFRKANLKLDVTPQITPDGNVILDVDVNKDSVGQATSSGLAIDTKHVKTQVRIDNGGTVVIGGIYMEEEHESVDKVPVLGDIPYMGNLFKTSARKTNKTELLIFLTPKVLTDTQGVR